ncbi:MAG: copper homeostasis protein CutC [Actinomycetes bacterium]
MTLLEICLDDLGGAAIAEENGADRIELCADLPHGGTTPSLGTVSAALASITSVGVQVLIRQRPGDFVYRGLEIDAMVRDIEVIAALSRPPGVTVGFVVGALRDDGRIDVPVMTRLLRACGPAPVTLHRAFDATAHPLEALEVAVDLGIHRVLTAGGPGSADTQLDGLATLVRAAAGRISILAAGGIRAHNVAEVVRRTGVGEVHLRATPTTSPSATSAEVIRAVRTELA